MNKYIIITSDEIDVETENKITDLLALTGFEVGHWAKNIWFAIIKDYEKLSQISNKIDGILISSKQSRMLMIFKFEDDNEYSTTMPRSANQWLEDKFFGITDKVNKLAKKAGIPLDQKKLP